jgi:MarR family transcriptional regulator for hemolysin
MWRQAADRALSGMGLSAASGWALVQVGRMGDDVRQTDLARELDVTGATLVRLLDQMVTAGLVERRKDPVDARVSRIRPTDRGRDLLSSIESTFVALRADALSGISDDDLATALAVAEHLEARFLRRRGVA